MYINVHIRIYIYRINPWHAPLCPVEDLSDVVVYLVLGHREVPHANL